MTTDPGLPLPAAVLSRLRSSDTLRAELAGVTAERDALREQLDTTSWERDTAQNEAAYLRDVITPHNWRAPFADELPRTVGLLLTMGDEPPLPPEHEHGEQIALVSLSTAQIYVRHPRAPEQWMRYGQRLSVTDFTTMAENGPWITVDASSLRDHDAKAEAARRLYSVIYDSGIGQAPWPEAAQRWLDRIKELGGNGSLLSRSNDPADWIDAWHTVANAVRGAWAEADKAASECIHEHCSYCENDAAADAAEAARAVSS